jgi:hypothetical protein
MITRLLWACVCIVVWPVYYVWIFARWMAVRPWRATEDEERLWRAFRSPPYVERLRAGR